MFIISKKGIGNKINKYKNLFHVNESLKIRNTTREHGKRVSKMLIRIPVYSKLYV